MNRNTRSLALFAAVLFSFSAKAQAADQIRMAGSSTVFPFAASVAEQFGKNTQFKTPIVESTGTGGGFKLFCSGVGEDTIDIANASRKIKDSEIETCKKNGVTRISEVAFGYDGIVLANAKSAKRMTLTSEDIWRALAKNIPVNGQMAPNPNKKWSDIDPALPAIAIRVYGPPPTSGTRDAFAELILDKGCKDIAEIKAMTEEVAKKAACSAIREDGAYVEAGENDNLIVQKLEADPDTVGIFGYSFLEQNADKIQGALLDQQEPTYESVASRAYPASRLLYFYIKLDHLGKTPGIEEYVKEFMDLKASGEDGYLIDKGLIPLTPEEHKKALETALQSFL